MAIRLIGDVLDAAGSVSGDFLIDTANRVRGAVCTVYRTAPGLIIRDPSQGFGKGLMDTICPLSNPAGTIGAPTAPFTGGQCCASEYRVAYTVTTQIGTPQENVFSASADVTGAILGGMQSRPDPANPGNITFFYQYQPCNSDPIDVVVVANVVPGTGIAVIDSVTLLNGVDNCGDPAPSYPTPSSTYPPPSAPTSITIPSPTGDGFDITIPLVYAPISPEFSLQPELNFDLGGVTLKIDFGGFEFGTEPNDSPSRDVTPADLTPINNGIDDILDRLDDLEECACPPDPDDPVYQTTGASNVDSYTQTGINLKVCRLTLTALPDKAQFGNANGQTSFFCGWFAWHYSGGFAPRQQLNFQNMTLIPPDDRVDGVTITFTNGARGNVVVSFEVE